MILQTLASFGAALAAVLAQSAPYVVLGYLVAALLHEFVAVEALTRGFGRSPWGVLRAVGVGLLLPVCSCGVVPLAVGLRRGGAALGTVLAFLVAAPATSPVAILVAWSALGAPLRSGQLRSYRPGESPHIYTGSSVGR